MIRNLLDFVFILTAIFLISRVFVPWGERASGNIVRRKRLSLLARLRMHGPVGIPTLLLALLMVALGRIQPITFLVVVAVVAILLSLPTYYLLTTRGIRAGWTPFRRWTEFGGVVRRPGGGVRLQGVAGARQLDLWLSGDTDDDEFVLLLRQLVRGSYKGLVGRETGAQAIDQAVSTGTIGTVQSGAG